MDANRDLLSFAPNQLVELVGGPGRARNIWRALREVDSPLQAATIGARTRARLDDAGVTLSLPDVDRRLVAECATTKLRLRLADGAAVETVIIPGNGRTTICLSSQVGCARGCSFCVTASIGLVRSLASHEILGQVVVAEQQARALAMPPVRNLVFMGMGEPLDNLDAVRRACDTLTGPREFGFAPGHVTLSTVGTSPAAVRKLRGISAQLAWSLHAADDEVRATLVPRLRHTVCQLRDAFIDALPMGGHLFVEMTLIEDVNDRDSDAQKTVELLAPLAGRTRVNLLPANAGRERVAPTSDQRTAEFCQLLRSAGLFCMVRRARGRDADAACGQLALE